MAPFGIALPHLIHSMDYVPIGVVIALDPAGRMLIGNRVVHDLLGLHAGELMSKGMPPFRTWRTGTPVRVQNLPLFRALAQGKAIATGDYEVLRRDGSSRILSIAAQPLFGDDGTVQGAVATFIDATPMATRERHMRLERDAALFSVAQKTRIAHVLENSHLPQVLPKVPGFALSGMYLSPANGEGVGGDWYDAFRLGDGRIGFSIGDVMGQGLEAAVSMARLRQSIHAVAMVHPEPALMLDAANATLAERNDEDLIATALAGILDPKDATLTFATAGHPLPLLRTRDDTLMAFEGAAPPLGIYEAGDASDQHHFAQLYPGDLAIFYTDGLIESTHDIELGERLLRNVLLEQTLDPNDSANTIHQRMTRVVRCDDDVAILTIARQEAA